MKGCGGVLRPGLGPGVRLARGAAILLDGAVRAWLRGALARARRRGPFGCSRLGLIERRGPRAGGGLPREGRLVEHPGGLPLGVSRACLLDAVRVRDVCPSPPGWRIFCVSSRGAVLLFGARRRGVFLSLFLRVRGWLLVTRAGLRQPRDPGPSPGTPRLGPAWGYSVSGPRRGGSPVGRRPGFVPRPGRAGWVLEGSGGVHGRSAVV